MALELEQPGDLADHHVFRPIAQLVADALAMFARSQKRLDLHAAVDGGELFPRGDAGRDHQIGHGVGHADDGVAAPRGPAFAGLEKQPRPLPWYG